MFSEKHYVPAMRWRQGEYSALQELKDAQRDALTPLVDVPPIPWDFEEEQPAKTIDQHLSKIDDQMAKCWGSGRPIFLDFGLLDPDMRLASGAHPLTHVIDRVAAKGVTVIPVTGLDRDNDYQAEVSAAMAKHKSGLAIRVAIENVDDDDGVAEIGDLLAFLKASPEQADLILDFRAIQPDQVSLTRSLVVTVIGAIPDIGAFRTLTLLSGAFPVNLAGIQPGVHLVPRSDWALWQSVRSAKVARVPSFGDYTASHPDQQEIDPRIMETSASIRYASDNDWIVVRGRSLKRPKFGGHSQYHALSQTLKNLPQFSGKSFSWASDYIEQCAAQKHTGNPMTWRKVATNRHLVLSAHQIASLP